MKEHKCEVCGKDCNGRKTCPRCSMKKRGFKQITVWIKPEDFENGFTVQRAINLGVETYKKTRDQQS